MSERISDERLRELATWEPGAKTSALSAQRAEWIAMARELAELREQARWRTIETAPTDTDVALLFAREEEVLGAKYGRVRAGRLTDNGWMLPYYADNPPVSWMPLPEIGPLPGGDA